VCVSCERSTCFWNQFLLLSVNLISVCLSVTFLFPATTTSSIFDDSPLSPSITPSLFHSRGSKRISFTNLSHHRHSYSSPRFYNRTVSSEHLGFILSLLHCSFCLYWFVRQIKLATRQLLGARKYSLSYRIVYVFIALNI